MKKFLLICCVALVLVSCSKKYVIEGQLNASCWGLKDVYLLSDLDCEVPTIDTTIVATDGTFLFEGELNEPEQIVVVFVSDKTNPYAVIQLPFILEEGKIEIDATTEEYTIVGTRTNDLLNEFTKTSQAFGEEMYQLQQQYLSDQDMVLEDNADLEKLRLKLDSLEDKENDYSYKFVKENLDNLAGVFVFLQWYKYFTDEQLTYVFENASDKFKANNLVKPIFDLYEQQRPTAAGKPFTDFELQDLEGKPVRLSDFVGQGKYVVVDFWASWCGPCRRSMPQLKEIYAKYADKIDIVGVSLDEDGNAWKDCVEKLELPWHQMSDLAGWECKAAKIYGVRAIPHMMLIDLDGTIIAKDLNDASLEEILEKHFK